MKSKLAVIFLISTLGVMGQDYESFFEEFNVVLHQVQVNVLDKDGNPISGLTKDDFQVRLNGKLQAIETVEEIELETMVNAAEAAQKDIPEQARRLFVFFFDLRYSTKQGVLNARDAAREYVMTEMLPVDLAGVFTYTQLGGISMVTNFTNDTNHLITAIDTLGLDTGKNVVGAAGYYLDGLISDVLAINGMGENTNLLESPNADGGGRRGDRSGMVADHLDEMFRRAGQADKRNYEREVMGFMASMLKFGEGLRYIRGRKNMLWFSAGFDQSSLIGVSDAELKRNATMAMLGQHERIDSDQMGRGDVQSTARKVTEALQGSGTVVFAMDTSLAEEMTRNKTGIHTLNMFASDTGGRVFTNTNHFDQPLSEVKHITNHYYLVSFYPESNKRKDVGSLKIKVVKEGLPRLDIYASKGLLLNPDFKGMSDIEKNIHLSEYIARDYIVRGIPIEAGIVQVPMNNLLTKLNICVDFRGDYFSLPGMKNKTRDIEVFAIAIDQVSEQVFDQSYFQFSVAPEKLGDILEKTGLKYFSNLFVKAGDYKLKIVARDLETGKVGSVIQNITVDRNKHSLTGPVVLTDQQWVLIREPESTTQKSKGEGLDFSYPFQLGDQVLVPSMTPLVAKDQEARFFYMLQYRESALDQDVPKVQMMFMNVKNEYIQIPPAAIKAETELKKGQPHLTNVMVSIDLSQVPLVAGETYKLMAYFGLEGQAPLKSMSEVTIAGL